MAGHKLRPRNVRYEPVNNGHYDEHDISRMRREWEPRESYWDGSRALSWLYAIVILLAVVGLLYLIACAHAHVWPLIGHLPGPLFSLPKPPLPASPAP